MKTKIVLSLILMVAVLSVSAADLAKQFQNPPPSARPWVYWFWNNGNVNKTGITADLEAMKRVGIGGVIIMDVVERFAPPPGDADFMSAKWQELFDFAVSEAHRLGLKINMTNGPGWCGSSGPWITPALSMQRLISTNWIVSGPEHYSEILPKPDTDQSRGHDTFNSTVPYDHHFYHDIAVLAFPVTTNRIVSPDAVLNLTANLDADGKLNWDVPAGQWLIERIGHTTTGSSTRPPVKGGNGLECDKLSREAMDVQFTNMMGKLIAEAGPLAGKGKALVATHIDSWEVGSQNWTPELREEFIKRRGYDPTPYLPNIIGDEDHIVVGQPEIAERFRWDYDETISELLAHNYVGELARLAHEHGLRLSIEGYHLPFGDEATYTAQADEPMSEFWATGGTENEAKARQMASVAHVMGDNIVGAEAFTSGDTENWKFTPATIKALGDYEFSQGINRFVIHRYAFQPYTNRYPGSTMGPWGLHYERTETWWNMSTAWHKYLARCQYMLRQGLFVADLCYLRPQLPNQTSFTPVPAVPVGYKYDECSAEALMSRMSVKNGRLTLPDGMSYRLLVLPTNSRLMTPALVKKIKQLVADGATVFGPSPTASPSLTDYPECDKEVRQLAAEVWGNCDGETVTEHKFGQGKVIWGQPLSAVLKKLDAQADFTPSEPLNWIHRQAGDTQIYFIANGKSVSVEAACHFRVNGMRPELWNPQTDKMTSLAVYQQTASGISLPLRLEPSGSCFVVFRSAAKTFDPVTDFTRAGQPVIPSTAPPSIHVQKAIYGVLDDAARTRDVTAKVQALVDRGEYDFQVAQMAAGDDPAYNIVKTLQVNYTADGQTFTVSGKDPDQISLDTSIIFHTANGDEHGLTGEYFTNADLRGKAALTRTDANIDFTWNSGSPANGIPANNWSARWTGTLTPNQSGQYQFSLSADDGCRLFIDGKRIIDHWDLDSGNVPHVGKINLAAGQHYPVRIEYFQGPGNAGIHLSWQVAAIERPAEICSTSSDGYEIIASQPGQYKLTTASGKNQSVEIKSVPAPQIITGPWQVSFPPKWGAPPEITLDHLISLSESTNPGVKYFSGIATYTKTFAWQPSAGNKNSRAEYDLDLGDVQVMARVTLNGHDLGILWKPPFRMDVTAALKPGQNHLKIQVADLWPNRMIGDAALPPEQRFTWSSYEPFKADSPLPDSGLIGPVQLFTKASMVLP